MARASVTLSATTARQDVERAGLHALRKVFDQATNLRRGAKKHLERNVSWLSDKVENQLQTLVSGRAALFADCWGVDEGDGWVWDFLRDKNELTLPLDDLRSCSLKNSFMLSSLTEYSE